MKHRMQKTNNRFMATVSITLCAAILFASSQPVSAEESSASYREYLSGGTAGTGIVGWISGQEINM